MSNFRDPIRARVEFRLRDTRDLRDPRQAYRFTRACERRTTLGRELPPLGRGPLLDDPAYLAPYSDIDEGREKPYESDEDFYGVGATFP